MHTRARVCVCDAIQGEAVGNEMRERDDCMYPDRHGAAAGAMAACTTAVCFRLQLAAYCLWRSEIMIFVSKLSFKQNYAGVFNHKLHFTFHYILYAMF